MHKQQDMLACTQFLDFFWAQLCTLKLFQKKKKKEKEIETKLDPEIYMYVCVSMCVYVCVYVGTYIYTYLGSRGMRRIVFFINLKPGG